eukprot:5546012-Pyramimonas_sp.AAC.1
MAPKMLQEDPGPLQGSSERPRSIPRRPPRSPIPSKTLGTSVNCAFSPFRFRWPSEASRQRQEGPEMPQRAPR